MAAPGPSRDGLMASGPARQRAFSPWTRAAPSGSVPVFARPGRVERSEEQAFRGEAFSRRREAGPKGSAGTMQGPANRRQRLAGLASGRVPAALGGERFSATRKRRADRWGGRSAACPGAATAVGNAKHSSETRRGSPATPSRGNRSGAGGIRRALQASPIFPGRRQRRRGRSFGEAGAGRGGAVFGGSPDAGTGRSGTPAHPQGEQRRNSRHRGRESTVCEPAKLAGRSPRPPNLQARFFNLFQSRFHRSLRANATLSKLHKRQISERQSAPEPKSSPSHATKRASSGVNFEGILRLDVRLIPVEVNGTSRS